MNDYRHKLDYRINIYECSVNGLLSVYGLLNFMQNSAATHADSLGFGKEHLNAANNFWALSRMLIRVHRVPANGETITVHTWPAGMDRILARRDFEIMDSQQQIIVSATTSWAVVDLKTRRPVNPADAVGKFSQLDSPRSMQVNAGKVTGDSKDLFSTYEHITRPGELDVNHHINNANFVKWAIDSFPVSWISENVLDELEANYLSESVCDQHLTIKTYKPDDQGKFLTIITRQEDSREIFRVSTKWKILT